MHLDKINVITCSIGNAKECCKERIYIQHMHIKDFLKQEYLRIHNGHVLWLAWDFLCEKKVNGITQDKGFTCGFENADKNDKNLLKEVLY